ncbi:hypothetical protein [Helicobacter sp. 23-1045]
MCCPANIFLKRRFCDSQNLSHLSQNLIKAQNLAKSNRGGGFIGIGIFVIKVCLFWKNKS